MGKRESIRKERQRQQRKNILQPVLFGAAVIVIVAAVLIYPSLKPAADFSVPVFPDRPNASGTIMGSPDAPILVQDFSDFQCPSCKTFEETYGDQMIELAANGQIRFEYIPFSFLGAESVSSAEAAYCADEQGKFWEYHDILFANQGQMNTGVFNDKALKAYAKAIGLNEQDFNQCFDSNRYAQQIQDNLDLGRSFNIPGTPSFLVNGELASSANLLEIINNQLAQ